MVDINKLCPYCMLETIEYGICTNCKQSVKNIKVVTKQLKYTSILQGKYLVGEMLGEGGFGITYMGLDLNLENRLAIKEFFPEGYAMRDGNVTNEVTFFSGAYTDIISAWKNNFLQEAQALAKCSNLHTIVGVKDFFQENNTVYIVMEYVEGETLKDYVIRNNGVSVEWIIDRLIPVMKDLDIVHQNGIIHRDISPDNLMVLKTGNLKLIDFGASRSGISENANLPVLLKPGYAPEEQYRSEREQGSWTDVYAMACTIYYCLTGIVPQDAPERMKTDCVKLPSDLGIAIDEYTENVLMKAMATYREERYQTMAEVAEALSDGKRKKAKYERAISLLDVETLSNYQNIVALFTEIGDFEDSKKQLEKAKEKLDELTKEKVYLELEKAIENLQSRDECECRLRELDNIGNYKDSEKLKKVINDKIIELEKDEKYEFAMQLLKKEEMTDWLQAKEIFEQLGEWKECDKQLEICNEKIRKQEEEKENKKIEENYLTAKRLMNEWRMKSLNQATDLLEGIIFYKDAQKLKDVAEQRKEHLRKKYSLYKVIAISSLACASLFLIVYFSIIKPRVEREDKYELACIEMEKQNYTHAKELFIELGDYKDSKEQTENARTGEFIQKYKDIYDTAKSLYNQGDYGSAINKIKTIKDYEQYLELVQDKNFLIDCREALYNKACKEFESGNYKEVIQLLESLDDYSGHDDIQEKINSAKDKIFENVKQLYEAGNYKEVIENSADIGDNYNNIDEVNEFKQKAQCYLSIDDMKAAYNSEEYEQWVAKRIELIESCKNYSEILDYANQAFTEEEKNLRDNLKNWVYSSDNSMLNKAEEAIVNLKKLYPDDAELDSLAKTMNASPIQKALSSIVEIHSNSARYTKLNESVVVCDAGMVYIYEFAQDNYVEKWKMPTFNKNESDIYVNGNQLIVLTDSVSSSITAREEGNYFALYESKETNKKTYTIYDISADSEALEHISVTKYYGSKMEGEEEIEVSDPILNNLVNISFLNSSEFLGEYGV